MATTSSSNPPTISHVLETCLLVRSIPNSVAFYKNILCLEPFLNVPRMAGFALGNTTLLLFQVGAVSEDSISERGCVPGHGPTSKVLELLLENSGNGEERNSIGDHFCFAVSSRSDVENWESHLREKGVKLRGTMDWEKGGRSVYFEDPDGHVGEIGSRGIWAHY